MHNKMMVSIIQSFTMENNFKFPFTILQNLTSWKIGSYFFKYREIGRQCPKVRTSGKTPDKSGDLEPLSYAFCKDN